MQCNLEDSLNIVIEIIQREGHLPPEEGVSEHEYRGSDKGQGGCTQVLGSHSQSI